MTECPAAKQAPHSESQPPICIYANQALGAQDLKPEKATAFGGGLTFAAGRLTASVDCYHIDIDDQIALSSNYVDASGSRRLRRLSHRDRHPRRHLGALLHQCDR